MVPSGLVRNSGGGFFFSCNLIHLRCHNEVILTEATDRMRPERERHGTPAHFEIRMMILTLGDISDLLKKRACFFEILKFECTCNLLPVLT